VPLKLFAHQDPVLLARLTGVLMNGAAAFGAALLAGILGGTHRRMALAGLVVALWPEAHPYMTGAACEPCAAAVLCIGTALICLGERYFFSGVLVLSLLPLVRPDFITIPVLMALAYLAKWMWSRKAATRPLMPLEGKWRARIALAMVLFYVPVGAWILRNYRLTGVFPVLAGVEGVTFYGSYNSAIAARGPNFGGWIPPESIPGQEKAVQLAKRMSEAQMIQYYRAKAWQFIEGHWRLLPVLMVMHAIHPFFPDPLEGPNRYVFWLCRLGVLGGFLLVMWRTPPNPKLWYGLYGLMLIATALATVVPAVMYNGLPRHFYTLIILAIPLLCSAGCAPAVEDRDAKAGAARNGLTMSDAR
jgi:hypothetical protein